MAFAGTYNSSASFHMYSGCDNGKSLFFYRTPKASLTRQMYWMMTQRARFSSPCTRARETVMGSLHSAMTPAEGMLHSEQGLECESAQQGPGTSASSRCGGSYSDHHHHHDRLFTWRVPCPTVPPFRQIVAQPRGILMPSQPKFSLAHQIAQAVSLPNHGTGAV